MRKQIWHLEVEYEWNTWRRVRGVKKETKKKSTGTFVTCAVGNTVKELNEDSYLMSCLRSEIKSTQNVQVKITGWKWRKEC